MKATTIAIIAAALVAVYFVFTRSSVVNHSAAGANPALAGGVPSLLNATSSAGWVQTLEAAFGGGGSAASGIEQAGGNSSAGTVVAGGAATVQTNANVSGFGSGGTTGGLTATQIAGANTVEASDENLSSLLSSGGITTSSNYGAATSLDLSEDPGLASFSDATVLPSNNFDYASLSSLTN